MTSFEQVGETTRFMNKQYSTTDNISRKSEIDLHEL